MGDSYDEKFSVELLGPTSSLIGRAGTPTYPRSSTPRRPASGVNMDIETPAQSTVMPTHPSSSYTAPLQSTTSSFAMVPYGARSFPSYDNAFALLPTRDFEIDTTSSSMTFISDGSGDVFAKLDSLITRDSCEISNKAQFMSIPDKILLVRNMMQQLKIGGSTSIVVTIETDADSVLVMHTTKGTPTSMQEYTRTMVSAMSDETSPCTWSLNVFLVIQFVYVLFTGCNMYAPSTQFFEEFAKVQAGYRTALGAAVKSVGAPLDVDFVCRDLATTLFMSITEVTADMQWINSLETRMSMITTAVLSSFRFVEAKRVGRRRELASAKQAAAVARDAYKTLSTEMNSFLDEDD